MRFIIAMLLLTFSLFTKAELPTQMNIYTTGSPQTTIICRAIFEEYDKEYGTKSVFSVKPGAFGMLAMLDMMKDKNFSVSCLTGLSELMFNEKAFPGSEKEHQMQTMVSTVIYIGTYFVVDPSSKFKSVPEVLNQDKDLTVGYSSNTTKFILDKMLKGKRYTLVPFKTSNDAIPSILDKSLDIYLDLGGMIPLINSGIVKSLGHINGSNTEFTGQNLNSHYPEIAKIKAIGSITTSKNNNVKNTEEMNARILKLLDKEQVVLAIKKVNATVVKRSVKESNDYADYIRKEYAK